MAAEDYGHKPVKVIDPTVRGLNERCATCGACDCHTSYLMTMDCTTVVGSAHRIYIHPEQRDSNNVLDLKRRGSETFEQQVRRAGLPGHSGLDELDLVSIRKAALECSARMARMGEIASDVVRRAETFAEWIQKGETS